MYCPRCGHQSVSNELRFCSYCGFKLGVVKAALADEEETNAASTSSSAQPISTPPRHRNINIGVMLMFLAALLAMLISARSGIGREGGGLILTSLYAAILLSSSHIIKAIYKLLSWGDPPADRLSTNRREMGFGTTLMFLGTVMSAILSFLVAGRMQTTVLPLGVLVTFVVLLVTSPYLLRALRYLIRDETTVPTGPNLIKENNAPFQRELPSAHEPPIGIINSPRVDTAEIRLSSASVTEHTTSLLSEK